MKSLMKLSNLSTGKVAMNIYIFASVTWGIRIQPMFAKRIATGIEEL